MQSWITELAEVAAKGVLIGMLGGVVFRPVTSAVARRLRHWWQHE